MFFHYDAYVSFVVFGGGEEFKIGGKGNVQITAGSVTHLFRLGGNSMYMKMYKVVQVVPWKNLRIVSLLQGNCCFVKRNVRSPAWEN